MSESISRYRHDCEFCEGTIDGTTLEDVQEQGRTHLKDHHYGEFKELFVDQMSGKACLDDCGYIYPSELEPANGFECPSCGADNFAEFADRHIWWNVEVSE